MAYEQKDNSGSLFKNDKRTSEKHPHATGSAMVGGVEFWVSAWTKTRDNGDKWVSLAFTPKEKTASEKPKLGSRATRADDEDIPW